MFRALWRPFLVVLDAGLVVTAVVFLIVLVACGVGRTTPAVTEETAEWEH
jgi:hypothetical protein